MLARLKEEMVNNKLNVLIFIFITFIGVSAYSADILSIDSNNISDSTYQKADLLYPDIYIIGIDERSLATRNVTINDQGQIDYNDGGLGPFQTWTRYDMANIITALNQEEENKPAVIGIDILYSAEGNAVYDNALVKAVEEGGNVVLGTQATFGTALSEDKKIVNVIASYEEPFAELKEVAGLGHINTVPDDDGVVRHVLHSLPEECNDVKNFSYEVASSYCEYWGMDIPKTPYLTEDNTWYLPYTGYPGDYYAMSVMDILEGYFDPAMFMGSIVLIGPYSYGMLDSYITPIASGIQMHGVEIHANAIQALLEENYKMYTPEWVEILIIIVIATLIFLVALKFDIRISIFVTFLILGAFLYTAREIYFNFNYITPIIYPLYTGSAIYLSQLILRTILVHKEKQKIKDIFQKYVDPKLVDTLILEGESDERKIGMTKDIAVLFVDIRGFTPMSEKLKDTPETLVNILNEYLELTSRAVFDNGGSVDKFIGDATMALFNGFVPLDDYVFQAICAGFDIVKGSEALNRDIERRFGISIGFGVGISCGNAVVGDLGPSFRKDFTAIGDTVNTAARLESNAKAGTVLISEMAYERVKDRITVNPLGAIPLKGKSDKLEIYQVTSILDRE